MLENLHKRLKLASNFPSPPAVAVQIIELAADPEADVLQVATVMSRDPALTAKILRIANSPLYARQRKSQNLRQAIVVLGLGAATTLALSFSLLNAYKTAKTTRVDYNRYWRRAILAATAARAYAELKNLDAVEEIFLAALLQDIAVLAIDRVQPDFYEDLAAHANHAELIAHETRRLGVDHASVSCWLLRHWKLPESLCEMVEWSHSPTAADPDTKSGLAARCLALGCESAEMLLGDRACLKLTGLSADANSWLGIPVESVGIAMERIVAQLPEIERLYDSSLMDPDACAAILEQAREMLLMHNLHAVHQLNALKRMTADFAARTVELEDLHRRDPLTGVFNRAHLDRVLEAEFAGALQGNWPLSIVFAALDGYKEINDTCGAMTADAVLTATARIILRTVRDSDCVARHGGEDFVIILPGQGTEGATRLAELLLERLRSANHDVAGGTVIATASIGIATCRPAARFANAATLLDAANRTAYAARRLGRNQLLVYGCSGETSPRTCAELT
jgi:diguanylate cyclase (GGDEF)-like protein